MCDLSVAKTILKQLGGNKFTAMTGAKSFVGSANSLSFHIGRNPNHVSGVIIYLNSSDLYDIEFLKFRKYQEPLVIKSVDSIYFDQLQDVFTNHTGLHTSL